MRRSLITSVIKAKPSVAKGKYIKGCTLSSTMGPGILLDVAPIETAAKAVSVAARRGRREGGCPHIESTLRSEELNHASY